MTDNILSYGEIVHGNDTNHSICILAQTSQSGFLFENTNKTYIGYDLDTGDKNNFCFFDASEVSEVVDHIDYNPTFPIFEHAMTMQAKVQSKKDKNESGVIIAVNPILIPLTFDYSYLVLLDNGTYKRYESKEIEYAS